MKRTLLLAAVLSATAFAAPPPAKSAPAKTAPAKGDAGPTAAGPTDPHIAAIVVAANAVDIDAGELAKKMSTNPDVQKFAEMMITDHTSVNKSATELCTKLGVTPEENDTSKSLRDGGTQNLAKLKELKGAAFDKAYVSHEVAYHVQVLDAIDKVLIPNAKNADLKALIVKVRPAIATHLEHARALEKKLGK